MKPVTLNKINSLKILDVADKLNITYSSTGKWRRALCFCHDDHSPSMGLNTTTNRWRCFVCGKGGSHIDLVMEHEKLNFQDACEWLIRAFVIEVPQQEYRQSLIQAIKTTVMNNSNDINEQLLTRFKGTSNEFTRAIVQNGILTQEQMNHASEVFRLSTIEDSVIFWQIDQDENIREGKVMYYQADAHRSHSRKPVSMSYLLKQAKQLPDDWTARHCLFGLHQLKPFLDTPEGENVIIAVVESEKTAIICSELLPTLEDTRVIWLATGGKTNLSTQALQPLLGHRVILFPDTDTTGETYHDWLNTATRVNKALPSSAREVTVSNILELHATEDQKHRKIDIADFINESAEGPKSPPPTPPAPACWLRS